MSDDLVILTHPDYDDVAVTPIKAQILVHQGWHPAGPLVANHPDSSPLDADLGDDDHDADLGDDHDQES